MKKLLGITLSVGLVFMLMLAGTAMAFEDIANINGHERIMELKEAGIINGVDGLRFHPKGKLTFAQGIHLIVKGLKLEMPDVEMNKKSKKSNKSWHEQSFEIARAHGLNIPKNVDPEAWMTKEQFTDYLMQAVLSTGDYAFISIYILINDEDKIDKQRMNNIQLALISDIAELDKDNNFKPKSTITRAQAAIMVHKAIQFVKNNKDNVVPPMPEEQVDLEVTAVNDEINKIKLSWGEQPNSGYGIEISSIQFTDGKAIVKYRLHYPDPDKMYLQVITYPTAVTYISSEYEVITERDFSPADKDHPSQSVSSPAFDPADELTDED